MQTKKLTPEQEAQRELGEKLQLKLLKRFDKMLDDGSLTAADAAVLARVLRDSGWRIELGDLPENLRDKLTGQVDPMNFEDEEDGLPV